MFSKLRCALRRDLRGMPAVILTLALIVTPSPVQAAPVSTVIRLRTGVTQDGITRITPADLQAAGVDPASVDPRTFAMSSLGAAVAIQVTGEADGRFDSGDQVLFFGEKFRGAEMDQKYTDERVYWLEAGGAPGPRIATLDAHPTGSETSPADFRATLRAEQSLIWWTLHTLNLDTQDTWFWTRLQTGANPGDSLYRDLSFTVPYPAPNTTATLRVEEIARNNSAYSNYYHRTTLAVNGTSVGTFDWQGAIRVVHTATVWGNVLSGSTATVNVGAINRADKGTMSDDIYVNYWELDYRRLFRAWQGQLDFAAENAGAHEYAVNGWTDANVVIWDVTTATAPAQLLNATVSPSDGEYEARFRAADTVGRRYWMQQASAFQAPASIRLRPDTGLRAPAGGADVVIVTHATLRPAAEALANWHRNHGRRALVADAQDVYDEFNHGIYHPKAIPAMLKWARANWTQPGPTYLTLVGDGHWNFKGYNPSAYPAPPIMIPPYLAWVDPWQGEVPADMLFGELTGDASPEVAVGRLLANTLDEAWTIVNKTIAYDESLRAAIWQRRALFIADNYDGNDFSGMSDAIINTYLPADIETQRVYLGITHSDAAGVKAAIRDAVNAGVIMAQFGGHGATWRWTHESIWTTGDVPTLTNGAMLPVVMTFNCLDGYFAHTDPAQQSMAEVMQRQPVGGTVAAISPSGLGSTYDQQNLRSKLMDALFNQNIREVGAALKVAKQQFFTAYGPNYLLYTQSLYGDPAMQLPAFAPLVPQPPSLTVLHDDANALLNWSAVTQDVAGQPTSVSSYAIWRGAQPYFQPAQTGCACEQVGATSGLTWTDANTVGNPGENHYWVVRAENGVAASNDSNRVGTFSYALTRGQ